MYPILLSLTAKRIVIVGGGGVAVRKAKTLLGCDARDIRVIAPEISPEMPAEVTRVQREFVAADLDGAALVFAATSDRGVNDTVAREAHARGILVNRADAEDDSDFATPALLQYDGLMVTVSTGGNPALSAKLRDLLDGAISEKWKKLAVVSSELRPQILKSVSDPAKRKEIFRYLATDQAADAAAKGDEELFKMLNRQFGISITNHQ